MAKQYDFSAVEGPMYAWWESAGYFKPGGDPSKPAYVVPMPPPNVTGYLHMGHAMFVALQVRCHSCTRTLQYHLHQVSSVPLHLARTSTSGTHFDCLDNSAV
jgi:hypothetical protein